MMGNVSFLEMQLEAITMLTVFFLQEALHREQMLENKLATLQRLVASTQEASESGWQVGCRQTLFLLNSNSFYFDVQSTCM